MIGSNRSVSKQDGAPIRRLSPTAIHVQPSGLIGSVLADTAI
jgi:hypothetical protein